LPSLIAETPYIWCFFLHLFVDAINVDAPLQISPERRPNIEALLERPGEGQIVGLIRFQDPMMPDSIQVPSRTIQVKWDSERKRRQGYFAQEEGDQKSPFRHYNKAGCDPWVFIALSLCNSSFVLGMLSSFQVCFRYIFHHIVCVVPSCYNTLHKLIIVIIIVIM